MRKGQTEFIKIADKSVAEVARLFEVSTVSVYRWLDEGHPPLIAWRIEREARLQAEQALVTLGVRMAELERMVRR